MKLTDYVAMFLAQQGITHVFGVTGGAVVHIFDSLAKQGDITPIFNHHEQAAAFAAEGYARIHESLGAAVVTTGPGGTNAITGVCAAWLDSVPCIYISGQARMEHTTGRKPIRQLGTQQLDIVPLVSHITKYAVMIDDPNMIKYHLEKAVYLATSGRPGPVWIDIPLDIQWACVEPEAMISFDASEMDSADSRRRGLQEQISECAALLSESERPLVLAGYGLRLGHATEVFREFVIKSGLPVVSSWNASDLWDNDSDLYLGRPGIFGNRGANLAIQNCDLVLALGSHLCLQLTGTNCEAFARGAKKIVVDIDLSELTHETVHVGLSVHCDVKIFLEELIGLTKKEKKKDIGIWWEQCRRYKQYNAIPSEWSKQTAYVNPYVFINTVSEMLTEKDTIVVDGGGTAVSMAWQALRLKFGQRAIISSGTCAMGSGLPESVGACFARHKARTICLCGDGSMQFNIQELQTIVHHNLNIKIFVLNNQGYLSIRHTQNGFLDGVHVGSKADGGMSLPDYQKVAAAYGLHTACIKTNDELHDTLQDVLQGNHPTLCELYISPGQEVIPHLGFTENLDGSFSARPLEDMYPYLDRDEFHRNMIVEPLRLSLLVTTKGG